MMSLNQALWILDRCHTRDDVAVGYTIELLVHDGVPYSQAEYVEAWGIVRAYNRRDRPPPPLTDRMKLPPLNLKHLRDY